jgi:gliding motility-associated-like protein
LSHVRAQAPVADFSATPTAGCGPLVVHFTDRSTNGPLFWSWDFGNGVTSSLQNPTVTYGSPGTYTVTLIARNRSGSDAMRKTDYITVYPFPVPRFTSNHTLACAPAAVQFTDQSTPGQGSITAWSWTFGDGNTSNQQNPSNTYAQSGYYDVTLKVTNSGGCTNTASVTRYLRVVSGIQPNFKWNQTSGSCTAPYTLRFVNQSAGPGNLSFNWLLGSGAVPANSTDTNPSGIIYPADGNYSVNLQVSSSLGCTASLQQTVPLIGNNASITGPTSVCVNVPAIFSNSSSPLPSVNTWYFGDGTTSDSTSTTKTWNATGSYNVKLVNKYTSCADSTIHAVQVINTPAPTFTATPLAACKPPLTVQFTDHTTPSASTWHWDFGDGSTSSQQNPSHTYTRLGNFTVTLTITTGGSCPGTVTRTSSISIQAPTVTMRNPTLGACVDGTATFTSVTPVLDVNSPSGVASYSWNAPGSDQGSSNNAGPIFTYPDTGTYTITATITTADGCTSLPATAKVMIGNPLTPSFTVPSAPVCGSKPVTFQSTTPGNPQNFIWDFGDHGSDLVGNPVATHQYHFYGPHDVTLTVYNNGCPQQKIQTVNIQPPFAFFNYALPTPINCSNESLIQFTDTSYENSAYGPISWSWDFGDPGNPGNTSTLQSPQHQYPPPTSTPQPYNVTFTITNGACSDTRTTTVVIGTIAAGLSSSPSGTACRNTPVTFSSTSTPASLASGFSWQVDGGAAISTSDTSSYQTSFTTNGNHSVVLIVDDQYGCPYLSPALNIQVNGPAALFSVPATGGACKGALATFTDHSTPNPSPIVSWSWNFGDDSTAVYPPGTPPFSHAYADTGFYQPLLTVTDNAGCIDTNSQSLHITSPVANFSGPDSFYCPGVPLTFVDSSKGYSLIYSWDFGDGSPPSPTPVHTFATSGTVYQVKLTVTDQNHCTSSLTRPVQIQHPVAAFNLYDTIGICVPLQTTFAAHGKFYDSLYWRFGDGTTSTLDSTAHFYNNYGIDTAWLFVEGPGGCFDSASRRVLVQDPYTATSFSYGPLLKNCDSVNVLFNIVPPASTLFTTVFGDKGIDSSQNTSPVHMYRNPATYLPYLTLTDPSGCIVQVNGGQTITVLGSTPFFSIDKHSFCDSGLVNMTDFSISNDGFASETYNFGDGSPVETQVGGSGKFNVSYYYNKPGLWLPSLTISTLSGCTETYTDTVRAHQTPHPIIAITSPACSGQVQFLGSLAIPEIPMDTVNWDWNFGNGQGSTLQAPTVTMSPGNYTVILIAKVSAGCADTVYSPTTIYPLPSIKGPVEITTAVGVPVTIPFTYPGDSIVSYNWTPATNLDCPTCPNPVATVIFSTEYKVSVTDSRQCQTSDSILIKTICDADNYFLPNTFSPNGDGVNDYFYPRGTSLYNIQSLTIFNRWGQMVFQRRDFPANAATMGWDGNFNGRPAATDTYVYVAEVICNNGQVVVLKGNVTLIR